MVAFRQVRLPRTAKVEYPRSVQVLTEGGQNSLGTGSNPCERIGGLYWLNA